MKDQSAKFAHKYVRQAQLPDDAYANDKGLAYYANNAIVKDWCRECAREIVNAKVIAYSKEHFGEIYCFNCQQKKRNE